jgi:hypothetical protein
MLHVLARGEARSSLDHPVVYVAGDLASVVDPRTGHVLPPLAQVALEAGETVAHNLEAERAGRPLEPWPRTTRWRCRRRPHGASVPGSSRRSARTPVRGTGHWGCDRRRRGDSRPGGLLSTTQHVSFPDRAMHEIYRVRQPLLVAAPTP